MSRGKIFFLLAFLILIFLVLAVVMWQRLQPAPGSETETANTGETVNMVSVVVITQKVNRGDVITENVVGLVPWQQDAIVQGMYTNIEDVVGKQAKFDLDAGIPVTSSMLAEVGQELSGTGSNAALQIPRGMVAISIPINRLSSVSYAPKPGDHLSVIATMLFVDLDTNFQTELPNNTGLILASGPPDPDTGKEPLTLEVIPNSQGRTEVDPILGKTVYIQPNANATQRPRMVTSMLLQDAVVLHVGDFSLVENAPAADQAGDVTEVVTNQPASQGYPNVITLIVTPQDAVTLNYMMFLMGTQKEGLNVPAAQLTLALRSAGDNTEFQTSAVTLQYLLDQYHIPVPVRLPYGPEPSVDGLNMPMGLPNAADYYYGNEQQQP